MASSSAKASRVPGHPSRRENHSISSNASGSSRGDRERGSKTPSPAVESAVTRLLVSIKQLLEALTLWSQQRLDEEAVSDVYVRLGNDFNAAVAAFATYNIDMSELQSVPDDLRNVLEQCLAEEASQEILEIYLPNVRQTITLLLQGLRGKQSVYRRIVSDHRHKSSDTIQERPERASGSSRREHRSQLTAQHTGEGSEAGSVSSRRSGKRRDVASESTPSQPQTNGNGNGNDNFVGGFAPRLSEQHTGQTDSQSQSSRSTGYFDSQNVNDRREATTPKATPEPLPPQSATQRNQPSPSEPVAPLPAPSPPPVSAPANMKRYSLVDRPIDKAEPPTLVEPINSPMELNGRALSPPPGTPPIESTPAVAKSLAALKSSDGPLERRASKRFSTYNFTKLAGGGASTTRERSLRGNPNHPNRRSLAANPSSLTSTELAVLAEEGDEENPSPVTERPPQALLSVRTATPDGKRTPHLPPLPSTPARSPEPKHNLRDHVATPTQEPADPSKITVFLQLGREVKKATVEPGLTFSSLRVLFVDKFSYNPGLENFPAIYIRDPSSGVQYELEDTAEVKEKCLLSLNIEPLDQIKQHIDSQIATLASDIKELKQTVVNTQRAPPPFIPDITTQPIMESTPVLNRPSERQFRDVARRLSRFVADSPPTFATTIQHPLPGPIPSQITGQSLQPQYTGVSVMSDYTGRIVTDLKTQFDEVQHLRRDLGVMRQLYTEFMKSTKESLATLRTQAQSVKQLANTNVGGARAYIDSGKKKLDSRTQNLLTEVEKLQDTIDNIKDDVIKRQVTPNQLFFKNIKKELEAVAGELGSLTEHMDSIRPMWKKTWEEELQNIVEEQQFLQYQEQFLVDLKEDHKAMLDMYGHVEKVITLRKPHGGRRGRSIKPLPADEGAGSVDNVLMEIRTAAPDHERRLEAIERNQKARQKDLASRSDEFQSEIVDFVSQKKLKMTGGAEEVERIRQKRSEMTLKAMFTGESNTTFGGSESPISPVS